jgi:hypothetical protein
MWKNILKPGRPQMTTWRMRITCWVPQATNAHSEYVIIKVFPTETVVARMRFRVTLFVRCLSTYSVILYSVQRNKVGFGDYASVLRSGDGKFQSQPGY